MTASWRFIRQHYCVGIVLVALFACLFGCAETSVPEQSDRLQVAVSVPPLAYLVEQIGGDLVDVAVLLPPGQSPATYEPSAKQLAHLAECAVLFRVGTPFEAAFLEQFQRTQGGVNVIDLREGLELLPLDDHHHGNHEGYTDADESMDPHVWMDPLRAVVMAETIADVLGEVDAIRDSVYRANAAALSERLQGIHQTIDSTLKPLRGRRLLVFHPAFGYFAERYGLEQVAVEFEGKEPSIRHLTRLSEQVKELEVKALFVQPQFAADEVVSMAAELDVAIVELNPLARDYEANLLHIAALVRGGLMQ